LCRTQAGVVSLIGTGDGDNYVEYTDWDEIEWRIMINNRAHFRLTENTPPMQEPLLLDLGYLGDTAAADAILDGTYVCPAEVDEYTKDFLACLQHPLQVNPEASIRTSITKTDFQGYWKKAKERTSSSWSRLHFGHYKAAATNDFCLKCTPFLQTLQSIQVSLPIGGNED
jgi:hypothetical protein